MYVWSDTTLQLSSEGKRCENQKKERDGENLDEVT